MPSSSFLSVSLLLALRGSVRFPPADVTLLNTQGEGSRAGCVVLLERPAIAETIARCVVGAHDGDTLSLPVHQCEVTYTEFWVVQMNWGLLAYYFVHFVARVDHDAQQRALVSF